MKTIDKQKPGRNNQENDLPYFPHKVEQNQFNNPTDSSKKIMDSLLEKKIRLEIQKKNRTTKIEENQVYHDQLQNEQLINSSNSQEAKRQLQGRIQSIVNRKNKSSAQRPAVGDEKVLLLDESHKLLQPEQMPMTKQNNQPNVQETGDQYFSIPDNNFGSFNGQNHMEDSAQEDNQGERTSDNKQPSSQVADGLQGIKKCRKKSGKTPPKRKNRKSPLQKKSSQLKPAIHQSKPMKSNSKSTPKNPSPNNPSKQGKSNKFSSRNQREQFQRQIAHIFVTKGYSLTIVKQTASQPINGNRLNSILTAIIRGALRKLGDIMKKNLNQRVPAFTSNEEQLLRSPLVNCRKWLAQNELNAFFKVIKIVYGINQEPVYQQEIINLYDKVMKQLGKRRSQYSFRENEERRLYPSNSVINDSSFQSAYSPVSERIQKVMTGSSQSLFKQQIPLMSSSSPHNQQNQLNPKPNGMVKYEREIVQFYIHFQNDDLVYQTLCQRYQQFACWPKQRLEATIQKLIKIGLKKILKSRRELIQKNCTMPDLNLNEQMVNNIVHSAVALPSRVAILRSLLQNNFSQLRTIQLINDLNLNIQQI